MGLPTKPSVGLLLPPVLISFAAFVLVLIALLAGTGPQQESLEPYHIIAVNLTGFGQELVASPKSSSPRPANSDDSPFGQLVDGIQGIGQDVTDDINHLVGEAVDKAIEELGISEWYSLHIMTACEGMFSPNASSPKAWYNMTKCTAQQAGQALNLSRILDHEFQAGPFHFNSNEFQVPDSVQNAIDVVNDALFALLVLYSIASGLCGLAFVVSLAVIVLLRKRLTNRIIWANIGIAGLSAFDLLVGSAVVTYINEKGIHEINDAGKDVGISGIKGTRFITLSWVTFGLMFFTSLYWALTTLKFTQKWIIVDAPSRQEDEKTFA